MENKEAYDRIDTAEVPDEYQLSLSDIEPPCGITDCLDDIIFSLCDTSHSDAFCLHTLGENIDNISDGNPGSSLSNGFSNADSLDNPGPAKQSLVKMRQLNYCQHLRHSTNADTVYLCERHSLQIITTTSEDYTEDTTELHQVLTSVLGNLSDCQVAFNLPDVRVFPDNAKLSFTVIPVQSIPAPIKQSVCDSQLDCLAIIVDADQQYREINPYIAAAMQAIYCCFTQSLQPLTCKQIQRTVFDKLKRKFTLCSNRISARRYEIFFEDLRQVTVHFERLLTLNGVEPDARDGRATNGRTDNGEAAQGNAIDSCAVDAREVNANSVKASGNSDTVDASVQNAKQHSEPVLWGWQAVASLLDNDQYPQALYQQAELWGESFATALDTHTLREATLRYKDVCEAANINSFEAINPLCLSVSSQSLLQNSYLQTLQELMEMGVIRGAQLVLELSEQTSVGTSAESPSAIESDADLRLYREQLQALRHRFGIRIGLREFGSGHSTLLRVNSLKPDVIKLSNSILPDGKRSIVEWIESVSKFVRLNKSGADNSNTADSILTDFELTDSATQKTDPDSPMVQILVDGSHLPSTPPDHLQSIFEKPRYDTALKLADSVAA